MEVLVIGMHGDRALGLGNWKPLVEVEVKQDREDVTPQLLNLVDWIVMVSLPNVNAVIWNHALLSVQRQFGETKRILFWLK